MRSELGMECRKLFRKMMAEQFPDYQQDKGQTVPNGWYVWTSQQSGNIWLYILLVIHHSRDQFALEAAWDFDGRLPAPWYGKPVEILTHPILFRPSWLWSEKSYWWSLVLRPKEYEQSRFYYEEDPIERCLPLVAPAVRDAAEKLKDFVVPTFEKITEKHGQKLI
jgi:hypothetical protein